MDLRDIPIIPKGRCGKALDATAAYIDKLEDLDVLKFTRTPTGRKYTSIQSLEAAAEWVEVQTAA